MSHTISVIGSGSGANSARARIGVKRQPFGLYPPEAPTLFVPHPDMWLVHEASRPEAVASRAGLSERIFEHWCREHQGRAPWLGGWLYGDDAGDENFPFTKSMYAFRQEAQVKRIAAATKGKRPLEESWVGSRKRRLDGVATCMIDYWRRRHREKYPGQEWFDGWLLRGQEAPPRMRVLTPDEVRRCAAAWNYIELARRAGVPWPQATYERWFDRPPTVVPEGPDRAQWLSWLYASKGCRRAPAFVVSPKLQAYRRRGTVKAITKAAGLRLTTVKGWRKDPVLRKYLEEAVQAARQGKEADSEGFRSLSPATRAGMTRYARAATKAARCRDESVDLSTVEFDRQVREATQRGVEQDLLDYLEYRGAYKDTRFRRQCGLINGRLFVPSEAMCRFHEEATKEWAQQRIAELEGLPGFEAWFTAWVTPQKGSQRASRSAGCAADDAHDSRRRSGKKRSDTQPSAESRTTSATEKQKPLPQQPYPVYIVQPPDQPIPVCSVESNGQPGRHTSPAGGNGTSLANGQEEPHGDGSPPSAFQLRILEELNKRIRTATQLQSDLGCDRKHLYREGLRPLMMAGKVGNMRGTGGGYYRPDALPEKYEEILGKK